MNSSGASIDVADENETSDIIFPNHIEIINTIAVDLGGSLIKVVYFSKDKTGGGRLNFIKFAGDRVEDFVNFIKKFIEENYQGIKPVIKTTGGGAYKYSDYLTNELNAVIQKEDEMDCLIKGLNFLVLNIPFEVFRYSDLNSVESPMIYEVINNPDLLFPYLLVNIGSGVSIIKVTGLNEYERISGTSLGGGTLWGLLSLLTDSDDFDEMLELSQKGENKNVDMLVKDIYGADYSKIGLKATTIASSFGKVFKVERNKRKSGFFKQEDIAASLLYMVSNNIGQIAYLNAKIHEVKNIYFGGFFIRSHAITMHTLSYAINFWSKGDMKALFLKHEGYLGSIGAFTTE